MAWSRDLAYSLRKNKLHLLFIHPKILHALISAFNLFFLYCFVVTILISLISTLLQPSVLGCSGNEVLQVLQNQCQVVYLRAGLKKKTIYRSHFPS